jgi:hypothetical protein
MQPIYVNPVVSSSNKKTYDQLLYNTPEKLQSKLNALGINIKLGNALKGGFASSQVYESVWQNKPSVVKHTEDLIPYDPTEIFSSKKGHNIDTKILKKLYQSKNIRVPNVYVHLSKITTTIMEDLRSSGYHLLHDSIMKKSVSVVSAAPIGSMLANLAQTTQSWKPFHTNESAFQNMYERGLELRLAYPNTQTQYITLEKEYTTHNPQWVWPDGHPKNILVTSNGDAAFIDFGRSHWGDQRFMLPNFLAHIVIYTLGGYIDKQLAKNFILACVDAYSTLEKIG